MIYKDYYLTNFRTSHSNLIFSPNNGVGRLYHFGVRDRSLKQFIDGKVNGCQKNNDGVTRKLVLSTIDSPPKKNYQFHEEEKRR